MRCDHDQSLASFDGPGRFWGGRNRRQGWHTLGRPIGQYAGIVLVHQDIGFFFADFDADAQKIGPTGIQLGDAVVQSTATAGVQTTAVAAVPQHLLSGGGRLRAQRIGLVLLHEQQPRHEEIQLIAHDANVGTHLGNGGRAARRGMAVIAEAAAARIVIDAVRVAVGRCGSGGHCLLLLRRSAGVVVGCLFVLAVYGSKKASAFG